MAQPQQTQTAQKTQAPPRPKLFTLNEVTHHLVVAKPVTLVGTVGPGATIALKTLAGRKVVAVKAGPVVIRVSDLSATQNFRLVGPGVNRMPPAFSNMPVLM